MPSAISSASFCPARPAPRIRHDRKLLQQFADDGARHFARDAYMFLRRARTEGAGSLARAEFVTTARHMWQLARVRETPIPLEGHPGVALRRQVMPSDLRPLRPTPPPAAAARAIDCTAAAPATGTPTLDTLRVLRSRVERADRAGTSDFADGATLGEVRALLEELSPLLPAVAPSARRTVLAGWVASR